MADVLAQPWEMMQDRRGELIFQGVTLRREPAKEQEKDSRKLFYLSTPLRVLLIISRPSDVGFLDPRMSYKPLLDAMETLLPGQVQINTF